ERADRVLHQRDQGRDDERRPRQEARGQLVAEALPAPGRRDEEQAPDREQDLDRLALPGPERGVPEARERGLEIGPTGRRRHRARTRLAGGGAPTLALLARAPLRRERRGVRGAALDPAAQLRRRAQQALRQLDV